MRVVCPYCNHLAKFFESSASFYNGRDYGPLYACIPCDAWVGCHPNTKNPLGRLANAELRKLKMAVHRVFDPIWRNRFALKSAEDRRYKKAMARGGRYKKLAELMEIPRAECHIGMFDPARCKQAIAICESGKLTA